MAEFQETVPIIEVDYDQLTYEMLKKEYDESYVQVETNKPSGPVNRLFSDLFGLLLLYAGTFVVCDLIRLWHTGDWTHIWWMFLGPWTKITGSPLIHELASMLGYTGEYSPAVARCHEKFHEQYLECGLHPFDGMMECSQKATDDQEACIKNTSEYSDCVQRYNDAYGYVTSQPGIMGNQDPVSAEDHCLGDLMMGPNTWSSPTTM